MIIYCFFFLNMVEKQRDMETKTGTKCYQCSVAVVIFGYQDTEHSVVFVWVCHTVFLTFLRSCTHMYMSQCVCVCLLVMVGLIWEAWRTPIIVWSRIILYSGCWSDIISITAHCSPSVQVLLYCVNMLIQKPLLPNESSPVYIHTGYFHLPCSFDEYSEKESSHFLSLFCPLFLYLSLEAPATRTVSQNLFSYEDDFLYMV